MAGLAAPLLLPLLPVLLALTGALPLPLIGPTADDVASVRPDATASAAPPLLPFLALFRLVVGEEQEEEGGARVVQEAE